MGVVSSKPDTLNDDDVLGLGRKCSRRGGVDISKDGRVQHDDTIYSQVSFCGQNLRWWLLFEQLDI